MNQLILTPSDILMLRDARPMEGALSGHTLPWPTPDLITHALRAALHRSGIDCHRHEYHPRGQERNYKGAANRTALYGSVLQAGPFPVKTGASGTEWYFPCPLDVELGVAAPTSLPLAQEMGNSSTLPAPLRYSVASLCAPSKENRAPVWFSASAWNRYAEASATGTIGSRTTALATGEGIGYTDVADTEHHYGIARDDGSATVKKGSFYSYTGLRLKPNWHFGSWVSSSEKDKQQGRKDVLQELILQDKHIVVGGQQRICTAELSHATAIPLPPMPHLQSDTDGKVRVKWVLLTPAIWSRHGDPPGGWLPTWVNADTGAVLLNGGDRRRYDGESRADWRARLQAQYSTISAHLVAAVVGKPVFVTGYATAGRPDSAEGPKTVHVAAPAGSVYYFECNSTAAAEQLCRALPCTATPSLTRRSELLGEQGFGLGLCAAWHFSN